MFHIPHQRLFHQNGSRARFSFHQFQPTYSNLRADLVRFDVGVMDHAALTEFNQCGIGYIVAEEVDPSKSVP
jgi:hypothetical protein